MTRTPAGELVSLGEAAQALSVSASTVRRWADEGRLRAQRTEGGHRRFALSDLQRMAASAPALAKPRMGLPLPGGLPGVGDAIEREDAALAEAAGKVVYEGRALGWYAQERSLRARREWARRLARAARSGDFEAAQEATGVLLRQAEVSGSTLLETSLFVERFGALVGSRLPASAPAGDRAGVQRLFTALRRHLLVGR